MSDLPGSAIPSPIAGSGQGQALYSLLQQLDQSQWWSADEVAASQLQQLKKLINYAVSYSSFYKQQLGAVDVAKLDVESFRALPLLTRAQLQEHNDSIDCSVIPKEHGSVNEAMTSGSTGFPVKFRSTALASTIWHALTLREHLWHDRDIHKVLASIRWHADPIGLAPNGVEFDDWGLPFNLFYKTSSRHFMNSSVETSAQIAWLQKLQPSYLVTHPSNLRALLALLREQGTTLQGLTEVRTVGESIDDELRSLVAEQLSVRLIDLYSSEELGYMALQCPVQNHYHVQSESVLLEVLREDGSPCDLHEPGKIVVSSLRNYATPLIRYEIGDFGELSGPCSCGRGLPVLKVIHGRVRNMLTHPDGSTHWPNFGFRKFVQIVPVKQFQIVQHSVDKIEMKLVVESKPSTEQEESIRQVLRENLGHPFVIDISYHEALSRSASGKFEDFVSLISIGS